MYDKFLEEPFHKLCEYISYIKCIRLNIDAKYTLNFQQGTLPNITILNIYYTDIKLHTVIIDMDDYYNYYIGRERKLKINKILENGWKLLKKNIH